MSSSVEGPARGASVDSVVREARFTDRMNHATEPPGSEAPHDLLPGRVQALPLPGLDLLELRRRVGDPTIGDVRTVCRHGEVARMFRM